MVLANRLYHNPSRFNQAAMLMSIIPGIVIWLDGMYLPTVLALLILTIYRFREAIREAYNEFNRNNIIRKFAIGMFLFAIGFIFYFLIFFYIGGIPIPVIILLYVILYLTWSNYFLSRLADQPDRPILRSDTTEKYVPHYDNFIILATITIFIAVVLLLFYSFVKTSTEKLFIPSELRWIYLVPFILIHPLIEDHFIQEIEWTPTDGCVRLNIKNAEPLEIIPSVNQPMELSACIHNAVIHAYQPNDRMKILQYLEDNQEDLITYMASPYYAGVLRETISLYNIMGKKSEPYLPTLHLLVMGSLSPFRNIGLIPTYNRFAIYNYIEYLFKLGYRERWLDLIEYEIEEDKDEYKSLNWIIHEKIEVQYYWTSLWDDRIYKGQQGYDILKTMDFDTKSNYEFTLQWQKDTIQLAPIFLSFYLGKESRQVFAAKNFPEGVELYLARKETKGVYKAEKNRLQQELVAPTQRYVGEYGIKRPVDEDITDENKRYMNRYLDGESYYEMDEPSTKDQLKFIVQHYIKTFGTVSNQLSILILMIISGLINIGIIYLIASQLNKDLALIVLTIEIVSFQFITASSTRTGVADVNEIYQKQKDIAANKKYTQYSLTDVDDFDKSAAIALAYSIILIFLTSIFIF